MPNNRLLTIAIITLFILPILPSCQTAVASSDDWPMYQHDPAHSGASDDSNKIYPVSRWNSSGAVHGIAISNGLAYYLVSMKTIVTLECVNASTGKVVWLDMGDIPGYTYSHITPAVVDGVVYIDTAAYNATTGNRLLDYSVYEGVTSPIVTDGLIFMGAESDSGMGCIFALDADTGALVWKLTNVIRGSFKDWVIQCPIAVGNGVAFFASGEGIYSVNTKTGNILWKYPIFNYPRSAGDIAISDGYVFACVDSVLYCLNASSGQKVWNASANGVPVISDDLVIAEGKAYNLSTGEKIWSLGKKDLSMPVITGGAVYYGHYFKASKTQTNIKYGHELLGANISTGEIFWKYNLPEINEAQKAGILAIADSRLYVSDVTVFSLFPEVVYPNVLVFDLTATPPTPTAIGSNVTGLSIVTLIIVVGFIIASLIIIFVWRARRELLTKSM